MKPPGLPKLMTPAEVAEVLNVDPKTLARWALKNKIRCTWTPGGTRRYYAADVEAIVRRGTEAGVPLLDGWRREVAGADLLKLA